MTRMHNAYPGKDNDETEGDRDRGQNRLPRRRVVPDYGSTGAMECKVTVRK